MERDFVTVKTFSQLTDAGLVQSYLESEGIPTFIKDALIGNVYVGAWITEGIKLQVRSEDLEYAVQKLKEGGYLNDKDIEPSPLYKKLYEFFSKVPILKKIYNS